MNNINNTKKIFPLQDVVNYILSTKNDAKIQREIAKGLNKYQEDYAYKHIIGLVDNKWDEEKALKIGSLISNNIKINHNKEISFGKWCSMLKYKQKETRIRRLHSLNFIQVIEELNRIMQMSEEPAKIYGFNWYDLVQVLYYWGDGISEKSLENRTKILKDFYRANLIQTNSIQNNQGGEIHE